MFRNVLIKQDCSKIYFLKTEGSNRGLLNVARYTYKCGQVTSHCRYSKGHIIFLKSVVKFLAAERSSCLVIVLSTKLFAQTVVRSIFWRMNLNFI